MNHRDLLIQRHLPQQMIHARIARNPRILGSRNRQAHRQATKTDRKKTN
jgi:hypothetical protein